MLSLFLGTSLLAVSTGLFFNNVSAVKVTVRNEPLTSADRFSNALLLSFNVVNAEFHENWKVTQLNNGIKKYVSEHDDFPQLVCKELGEDVSFECLGRVGKYAETCKNGNCFHLGSELLYGFNGFDVNVFDHYGLLALFYAYKHSGLYDTIWPRRKFLKLTDWYGKGYSSYGALVNGILKENITNDAHYSESQVLLANYFNSGAATYETLLNRDPVAASLGNSLDWLNVAGVHFKKRLRDFLKTEFKYAKFPVGEKYFKGAAEAFQGYLTSLKPSYAPLASNFAETVVDAYEEEALGRPRPWHKKVWDLITGPWKRHKVGEKIRQPFIHAGAATKKFFTETLPQGVNRSNARVKKFFHHTVPKKANKIGTHVNKFFSHDLGKPIKKGVHATQNFFTHTIPNLGKGVAKSWDENVKKPVVNTFTWRGKDGEVDVNAANVGEGVGDTLGAGDLDVADEIAPGGEEAGGAVGGEELVGGEGSVDAAAVEVGGEPVELPVVEEGVSGEQSDVAVNEYGAGAGEGAGEEGT